MSILLTDSALEKLREIKKGKVIYFKTSITGGGCSGFKYIYEVFEDDSHIEEGDYKKDYGDVVFFTDENSLMYLKDSEIDYKVALLGSDFQVTNPNARSTCGCAQSFVI